MTRPVTPGGHSLVKSRMLASPRSAMTDAEITARFVAFRAAQAARRSALAHTIACTLAGGDTVREHLGRHTIDWTLSCARVGLLPDCITLPWMVDHLVARHVGFGTSLEFPAD